MTTRTAVMGLTEEERAFIATDPRNCVVVAKEFGLSPQQVKNLRQRLRKKFPYVQRALGRPPQIKLETIHRMLAEGIPQVTVARQLGVSRSTVTCAARRLREAGVL